MKVFLVGCRIHNEGLTWNKNRKDFIRIFITFVRNYLKLNTMKTIKRALGCLLSATLVVPIYSQPCANPANIYSFTYNGKTYEVVKEMKDWINAAACAVERGGYLVEIGSAGEQAAVYDGIINGAGVSPGYTVVPDGGGIAYVWIGATDKEIEGTWLWDGDNTGGGINFWNGQGAAGAGGGSAVGGAYVNWGGASTGTYKEPDNFGAGQDAAAIALAGWPSGTTILGIAGEWNDINSGNSLYFVVEMNNTGVNKPNPGSIHVYPNPAKDFLTVQTVSPRQEIRSVRLFSVMGKTMAEETRVQTEKLTIATNHLSPGIYLLSVMLSGDQQIMVPVAVR